MVLSEQTSPTSPKRRAWPALWRVGEDTPVTGLSGFGGVDGSTDRRSGQ
jgi:hypothetical protein